MVNLSNPEYYRNWKTNLYNRIKVLSGFSYKIFNGAANVDSTVTVPANSYKEIRVRLRRGPQWYMYGIRLGVPASQFQGMYITLKNVGGYPIIDRAPLSVVCGTVAGKGDTFLPVCWQWKSGEDMLFTIHNDSGAPKDFRAMALGKNIQVGKA